MKYRRRKKMYNVLLTNRELSIISVILNVFIANGDLCYYNAHDKKVFNEITNLAEKIDYIGGF